MRHTIYNRLVDSMISLLKHSKFTTNLLLIRTYININSSTICLFLFLFIQNSLQGFWGFGVLGFWSTKILKMALDMHIEEIRIYNV